MTPELIERFWSRVDKAGECWEWTGGKFKGYGSFYIGTKKTLAHRTAYGLLVEELPATVYLDHICHNKACVNPNHLRPVNAKQNSEHRSGPIATSKSGFRGVSWHKQSGTWQAKVTHAGAQFHLGYFQDPAEAGAIATAKRNELFTHNDLDRAA